MRATVHAFLLGAALSVAACAQSAPAPIEPRVGWYNGDWQSGLPGLANYYISDTRKACVYEDFVVPEPGWTVAGVFSNNSLDYTRVKQARWEIRKSMALHKGGKKVAGGVSAATEVPQTGPLGQVQNDGFASYRVQVDGLNVPLAPGRYWLCVAPVIHTPKRSYLNATKGANAVGVDAAQSGSAFVTNTVTGTKNEEAVEYAQPSKQGLASEFSLGVIVRPGVPAKK